LSALVTDKQLPSTLDLTQPDPALIPQLLDWLSNPSYTGCGHIKGMIEVRLARCLAPMSLHAQNPAYKMDSTLVANVVQSFFLNLWSYSGVSAVLQSDVCLWLFALPFP